MKKVLSIVLCAMVLVAMLSSSAFAVVKTVVLENNETAKNSAELFGSWKIVRAYNSETSTRSLHVIPQYKNKAGIWRPEKESRVELARGKGTDYEQGSSMLASSFEQTHEVYTAKLVYETYWRLRLNVDGANKVGCSAQGTIRE